jgi:hypothetical protein
VEQLVETKLVLPTTTILALAGIAKQAGTTVEVVVNVILALHLIGAKK